MPPSGSPSSSSASSSAVSSPRLGSHPLPPPRLQTRPVNRARATSHSSSLHLGQQSISDAINDALTRAIKLSRSAQSAYLALPLIQRVLVAILLLFAFTISILLLIFNHAFFGFLAPIAARWRELPGGWIPVWLLVFCTAFPPMVGYSFGNTLAGFVFGFPGGWPLVASAAVSGSLASFVVSRTIASAYVHRLVGKDPRFLALGQVLRRDGLFMLTMIRFCPLPFSLSNGFLATIPSITPWAFAVSTAISSPKLLVHVFIGSRLALLAEHGDTMTSRDKAINYMSMIIGVTIGITVGYVIYRRTMARAAEIARQTASSPRGLADLTSPSSPRQPSTPDYADIEAGLLDPDDAAAIMDDDDLSLWDAPDSAYRDDEPVVMNGHVKTVGR